MTQIQTGLKDVQKLNKAFIENEVFNTGLPRNIVGPSQDIEQIHPDLVNSVSIDVPKNRITKSINIMSEYIFEFESVGAKKSKLKKDTEALVEIIIIN
jgi:hypothetical protein